MNVEDEYLTEMINLQNDIAFLKDKLEQARKEKEEAMRKLAIKMKKYGESINEIIKETGLTRNEIEEL
jgi:DNA-binding protein H-NS